MKGSANGNEMLSRRAFRQVECCWRCVSARMVQQGGSEGVAFVLDLSEQKRAEAENHSHRRSHWFRCIGLSALALLAAPRPAIAVDLRPTAADYLSHTFTTADGLPSNVVNDVLQTRDGFLIVGAATGVFRFDGHRFAEMNSDPPKEIIARSLAEGPDGDLWVATRFGVYRFPHAEIDQRSQTLSVFHLGQGAADSVRCLRFTHAGVLWAGTPYGLFYFAKDHFQQAAAGLTVIRIEEARNGHLLVATTHGFFEWDGYRVIEHPEIPAALGIHAEDVFHVLQDRSGVTWYCTEGRLSKASCFFLAITKRFGSCFQQQRWTLCLLPRHAPEI